MPQGAYYHTRLDPGALWGGGSDTRKVIMQNAPTQSVNEREKVGCFRNNTPNHTLTDLKARQSSKILEIGEALITAGFISLDRAG